MLGKILNALAWLLIGVLFAHAVLVSISPALCVLSCWHAHEPAVRHRAARRARRYRRLARFLLHRCRSGCARIV